MKSISKITGGLLTTTFALLLTLSPLANANASTGLEANNATSKFAQKFSESFKGTFSADFDTQATITPAPTAVFTSPADASSSATNAITVQLNLQNNNNASLVGKQLLVGIVVTNSADYPAGVIGNPGIFGVPTDAIKQISFTTANELKPLTFENVPLVQPGDNFITCLIVDSSGNSNYCGEYSSPDYLKINYTGNLTALYRLWSDSQSSHFYTKDGWEMQDAWINNPNWDYERIAYYVTPINGNTCVVGTDSPVYRFWSDSKTTHFYTIQDWEKNNVIANDASWAFEGPRYCASKIPGAGLSEVYRFWSNTKQTHFYTIQQWERDNVINNDPSWSYESGQGYYARL